MEGSINILYYAIKPFFKAEDYIRLAQWNECCFEKQQTDYYINLYSCYSMNKEMIRREWLEHAEKVEFEGKEYLAIGDIDLYLSHMYGDYMTPPPEDQRKALHSESFKKRL